MSYNVLLSVDFVAYVLQKSYFLTQNGKMAQNVLNCPTFSFQNSCRLHGKLKKNTVFFDKCVEFCPKHGISQ